MSEGALRFSFHLNRALGDTANLRQIVDPKAGRSGRLSPVIRRASATAPARLVVSISSSGDGRVAWRILAHVFGSRPRPLFVSVATVAHMPAVRAAPGRVSGLRHGGQRRKNDDGAKANRDE